MRLNPLTPEQVGRAMVATIDKARERERARSMRATMLVCYAIGLVGACGLLVVSSRSNNIALVRLTAILFSSISLGDSAANLYRWFKSSDSPSNPTEKT